MAQRGGVCTQAFIERQYRQVGPHLAGHHRAREVNGVERANRFHRERPRRERDHSLPDLKSIPLSGSGVERRDECLRLRVADQPSCRSAVNGPGTLNTGQLGRNNQLGRLQELDDFHSPRLIKKPCQHRAGLGVDDHRGLPFASHPVKRFLGAAFIERNAGSAIRHWGPLGDSKLA